MVKKIYISKRQKTKNWSNFKTYPIDITTVCKKRSISPFLNYNWVLVQSDVWICCCRIRLFPEKWWQVIWSIRKMNLQHGHKVEYFSYRLFRFSYNISLWYEEIALSKDERISFGTDWTGINSSTRCIKESDMNSYTNWDTNNEQKTHSEIIS